MNKKIAFALITLALLSGCITEEPAWQTTVNTALQKIEEIGENQESQPPQGEIQHTQIVLDASKEREILRVNGRVIDSETLEPIENATVTFSWRYRDTNETGEFEYKDIATTCPPEDECQVRARAKGYYTYETQTMLEKGINEVTIKLVKE